MGLDIRISEDEKYIPGKLEYNVINKSCGHSYKINYTDVLRHGRATCPLCRINIGLI